MSWAAANAPKVRREPRDLQGTTDPKRRSSETVEAALSRLSKAYTISMECIGVLHKTDRMLQKDPSSITPDAMAMMERVSSAARQTLEKAILVDPLVVPHIPALNRTMRELCKRHGDRWYMVEEPRPIPPVLSSAAHKTTIRELAYLALVNYSDLLQICSGQRQPSTTNIASLLDRGVIEKLSSLEPQGCWVAEPHEDTQRLAVTALCDASSLDGTDPTLWLKLACASRGLENLLELSIVDRSKHRRLQRYALEQGHRALPPHMPPNRAIQRALEELLDEPEPEEYESHAIVEDPIKIILDLPRYSWSMLGRMLLRATREGADYQVDFRHGRNKEIQFGSPMIVMNLSPMLVLPTSVLGRVCLFLDNGSIWRFEATCRALSVAIMSARAAMEEEPTTMDVKNPITNIPSPAKPVIEKKLVREVEKKSDPRKSKECENASKAENHRSSQRLRSQQITSGKKAERLSKRQSFEYCFLATTAGTTVDQHKAAVQEASSEERVRRLLVSHDHGRSTSNQRFFLGGDSNSKRREAQYSIGDSSLAAFVETWSNVNSGPIDLIMKYLTHIAMHVEDVFASDPGGTVVLTSCILSCYEARLKRSGFQDQLVPQFYESHTKVGYERSVQSFALDLLHGELLLKQCDRYSPLHVSYDDDCNIITLMVPNLFQACQELQEQLEKEVELSDSIKKQFTILKIRCNWLLAVYFLWRSRITQIVSEAQEAEEEGIAFIEEALNSFQMPCVRKDQVIPTPHLVSPGRVEQHWKEISLVSLTKYRDEIQASAVVSVAREKFQDLIAVMTQRDADIETQNEVFDDDGRAFAEIGVTLLDRYKSPYGASDAKHSELVDDFLRVHGNDIIPKEGEVVQEWEGPITFLIPLDPVDISSLRHLANPSILSMLLVCMNMQPEHQHHVLHLLLCLVFATKDLHEALLQQLNDAKATRRGDINDDVSDSDDDSVMSESSGDRNASTKNMDEKRAIQCGHFVAFLVNRIRHCFLKIASKDEKQRFILEHSEKLVQCTLDLSSRWFDSTAKHFSAEDMADLSILHSVSALIADLREIASPTERKTIDKYHLVSLVQTMIRHRQSVASLVQNPGDRSTRIAKQKLCVKRTKFLTGIASDIGLLLSVHLGKIEDSILLKSEILIDDVDDLASSSDNHGLTISEWNYFVDSILWLWNYSSQSISENPSVGGGAPICSSFDRPIISSLRVPVATAVIGLCGAAASSRIRSTLEEKVEDPLSLMEFYDSDASANDILSDDEDPNRESSKQKELLRVVCHAVQCVGLVLDKIDDKGALSVSGSRQCAGLGPAFPLVASRVLNHFADTLLSQFTEENQEVPDVWSAVYPSATRTTGELVDSNLHKVYRWLYGFVLVGEKAHLQLTGKDLASAPAPIVDLTVKDCKMESVAAAAQLYRCITRAYSGSRRSPPKKALELVWSTLPPFDESEKSKALRSFVFSAKESHFSHDQIIRLVKKKEGWNSPFSSVDQYLLPGMDEECTTQLCSEEVEVAMRVRRGILAELAGGQLPLNINDNSKGKSDQTMDDDRLVAIRNEAEITKKFDAIVDDLCLGNSGNTEGWYRAAQCLNMKAELIADRLGLSLGFARSKDFVTPSSQSRSVQGIDLEQLIKEQELEHAEINANWLHYLGDDLSVYAKYSWASYESLRACADDVRKRCNGLTFGDGPEGGKHQQRVVWKIIDSYFRSGNFLAWQEAWGGIFVLALRKLALRFISVAVYLLQEKKETSAEEKVLLSELCESFGIILYSELMGSQSYGYPMRPMGLKRKRDIATTARICFQAAIDLVVRPHIDDEGSDDDHATWDLLFMVGKCDEKVAGTYKLQAYSCRGDRRLYENFIGSALDNYAAAYAQAKKIEADGGFIVDQSGGSAHGCTEILYRIHASRLKCLVSGATRAEKELQQSEEEALRLAERHWFKVPENLEASRAEHARDRIWNVLSDVVSALAQCRIDQSFFHRSVYRHAQALMWSPLLYDPTSSEGSLDSVPATRSFQIRGLNNSTPAVHSAEIIMSALFDKKRPQLCAVWVTTTSSSSPFQVLNNSTRKYDSLRGKYISAYLETLRLSRRRGKLEEFIKSSSACRRDLPGYFQASALAGGGVPSKTHFNDPLLMIHNSLTENGCLTTIKRQANSAFADVLIHEMSERSTKSSSIEEQKQTENYLKYAYASYLRLHCSRGDLNKVRAWKYGTDSIREVEALCQAYLGLDDEMGDTTGKADYGDWSGGGRKAVIFDKALAKCKALFPTLSGAFFSKKAITSGKSRKGSKEEVEGGEKRKEPDGGPETSTTTAATMSFEVAVPVGLAAGDSFFTTVKVGGATKKLKLTVPKSNPSTLRFHVPVSQEETTSSGESVAKKARKAQESPESGDNIDEV